VGWPPRPRFQFGTLGLASFRGGGSRGRQALDRNMQLERFDDLDKHRGAALRISSSARKDPPARQFEASAGASSVLAREPDDVRRLGVHLAEKAGGSLTKPSAIGFVHHRADLADLAPHQRVVLLLTLTITSIEVVAISAVVRHGGPNPTLMRDTLLALIMIIMNGMVTIPSVLVINHLIERPVVLGVEHTDLALLILTLALSMITFTSGRTNMLQGVVHLLLFAAYILLIFQA
jgi:hypothetical protein